MKTGNFAIDYGIVPQLQSFTPKNNTWVSNLFPPTQTEQKIQQMVEQDNSQFTQTEQKNILSKKDLFEDINKMRNAWVQWDDSFLMWEVLRYYKEKWLSVEGVDIDSEIQRISSIVQNQQEILWESEEKKWFLNKIWDWFQAFWKWVNNLIGWAVSWWIKWINNTFNWALGNTLWKWIDDVFWLEWNKSLRNAMMWSTENLWNISDSLFVQDPSSNSAKVWEFVWELWLLFTPTPAGKATLLQKYPQAGKIIETLSTKIDDMAKNSPTIYKIIKWAVNWTTDMAKFNIVDEAEISTDDLKTWAVIWWALPVAWKVWNWGKNKVWELSNKMMTTQLVNPADLKNLSQRLSSINWGKLNIDDVAEWMKKNKMVGSKDEILTKLDDLVYQKTEQANNILASNTKLYSSENTPIISKLKQALSEKMQYFVNRVWDDIIPTAWNDDIVNQMRNIIWKKELSLTDINAWRRILAEDLFTALWDAKASVSQKWWMNVWKETSKYLDDMARWFRNINKDVEVWLAMMKWIEKKEANEAVKRLLGYAISWGTIGWVTSVAVWESDLGSVLKNMLIGGALWAGANKTINKFNSTEIQTRLGALLWKLWPSDRQILENAVKTWVIENIPVPILTKLDDALRQTEQEVYNTNISKYFSNSLSKWEKLSFWSPGSILEQAWYANWAIEFAPWILSKHPELNQKTLQDLYWAIQDPVAILKAKNGNLINITQVMQDGMPVIIATETATLSNWNKINAIKSIHQRDFWQIMNLFSLWEERMVDTNKLLKLVSNDLYEDAIRKWIITTSWQDN